MIAGDQVELNKSFSNLVEILVGSNLKWVVGVKAIFRQFLHVFG